jgi:type VI secretion system protein VasG
VSTNLKALIDKLNDTTRRALEAAAGLCVARTHYDIEIEHYLMKVLDGSDNDIAAILKHFGVDRSRLTKELERSLDSLKSGNARSPAFSPTVVKMLSEAWTVASIDFNAGNIRTGFTLLALLGHDELARIVKDISKELQIIYRGQVKRDPDQPGHRKRRERGTCRRGGGRWSRRQRQDASSRSIHGQSHCECQGGED